MALATLLSPRRYKKEEREAGKAAAIMGMIGISEGAIPFAAADPVRVIPAIVAGGIVGNITGFMMHSINHAPWGGWIVLPVVEGKMGYILGTLLGALTTALIVNLLKKPVSDTEESNERQEEYQIIEAEGKPKCWPSPPALRRGPHLPGRQSLQKRPPRPASSSKWKPRAPTASSTVLRPKTWPTPAASSWPMTWPSRTRNASLISRSSTSRPGGHPQPGRAAGPHPAGAPGGLTTAFERYMTKGAKGPSFISASGSSKPRSAAARTGIAPSPQDR